MPGRGRWPLGSDEFSESGVEFGSVRRVDPPVGSTECQFPLRVAFDCPPVFVEEPVVEPAQQDQVFEVCGPAIGPMLNVMTVNPTPAAAAGEPASAVPKPELPT